MRADVVFIGGAIFTGSGDPLRGYAVAVMGGRIAAVLPESELTASIASTTRVVDLEGGLLSPGFQDAHIHAVAAGVELLQCNLSEAENAEGALVAVADYAATHPDEPWVLGCGWAMEHFAGGAPTRGMLDAVVPDRPVYLMNRDHHGAWVNTLALEMAGVTADTLDPEDGRIEREPDGTPAGTLHEGAANLVGSFAPTTTDELAYRGLLRAQEHLISLGVTGWQDALVGSEVIVGAKVLEAYERAVSEGTLRVHVVGAQWWERGVGMEQIPSLVRRRDQHMAGGSSHRFNVNTVKIMVDGVAENYTAAMIEPYRDAHGHATHNHGMSFVAPDLMREAVVRLDAEGMQVHFHALGDRAVRDALDAVAAAREANGPSDGRHHLAHLQVVAESDAARFAEHDAVANIQALWACHEEQLDTLALPFMHDGAAARHYPFGEMHRAGARFAAGSDWPVSSADPLAAIQIAVTRVAPGSENEPLGGELQRLSLDVAFAAYTSGSAYVNHRDHDTGWLREGYLANLVVIRPNPFELAPAEMHSARVVATWIEGEEVFSGRAVQ